MKTKLEIYAALALALVLAGVYLDRKYQGAGGASGIASNAVVSLFTNAGNGIASLGGAALDAMPASQVPALVDQAGMQKTASTLWYESALMGGGN